MNIHYMYMDTHFQHERNECLAEWDSQVTENNTIERGVTPTNEDLAHEMCWNRFI